MPVFAISRLLTADLAPRTPGKTFYLPNGFCDWFVPDQNLPRPADLPTGQADHRQRRSDQLQGLRLGLYHRHRRRAAGGKNLLSRQTR